MAERRPRSILYAALALVLAAAALVWFQRHFEPVQEESERAASAAARRNPLLALERLLGRLRQPVQGVVGDRLWLELPPPGDTILVYDYRPARAPALREALWDWVGAGGHLVLGLGAADAAGLAPWGVHLHATEAAAARVPLQVPGEPPLELHWRSGRTLSVAREHRVLAAGPDGARVVALRHGRGSLVLLSEGQPFGNAHIGDHDHALAAVRLLRVGRGGKVWLVGEAGMPSLALLLWQRAPQVLAAAVLLVLLLLWRLGPALGPRLPAPGPVRRDLAEHLAAAGAFHWRLDRAQALTAAQQRRLEQAWLSHHPLLRALDRAERCAWIGARCGLSAAAVSQALYEAPREPARFIETSEYQRVLRGNL